MPRDLKDVAEGTFHCCYCGRRFNFTIEKLNQDTYCVL
jgi:transcription elongation factor Elf1